MDEDSNRTSGGKVIPITYFIDTSGNINLPDGPPFDGNPVLIKTNTGIVEAWWQKAERRHLLEEPDNTEGFFWVCYDDMFQLELDDAKFWAPLPT